ncbi:MAG: SpoIID/LytB domain-containing protein [candidate division KSB1 bacterium]|nr:SpoIID/LytB domain-containing protein [candidate division KSB1 bacterium]
MEERIKGPKIRVGLLENEEVVEFTTTSDFRMVTPDGKVVAQGSGGQRWQVKVLTGKLGQVGYRLLVNSTPERREAEQIQADLKDRGFGSIIQNKGKRVLVADQEITDNRVYQVYLKDVFRSQENAELYLNSVRGDIEADIQPYYLGQPEGRLLIRNLDRRQEFEFLEPVKIAGTIVTLKNVKTGEGFHYEGREDRAYRGEIEFRIGTQGRVTVINELPVEDYLRGVVPSEMGANFPLEALKAQAVAARGNVLRKIGLQHQEQGFDVCDEVHCQVYGGISKETENTNQAVAATRGLVLKYAGKLCDATFFSVCGGHTENSENVWSGEPVAYLRGVLDSDHKGLRSLGTILTQEDKVRNWIEGRPDVYCNSQTNDLPPALDFTKKYFRWEVKYAREELSRIIWKETGQKFGQLVDILPLKRGVSGRLLAIEIKGTLKSFKIEKELAIRKALSETYLYSSCFVVEKRGQQNGLPMEFILKGAGSGHGVGMCQTGAAGMALEGKKFDEILRHYYTGVELVTVY